MLNHIGQKLEVVNVADEVHTVHLREADKDVLWRRRGVTGVGETVIKQSDDVGAKHSQCLSTFLYPSACFIRLSVMTGPTVLQTQEKEGRDGYTHNKVGQCGVRQVIGKHLQLLCCRMEACSLRQRTGEHNGPSHSLFNLETLSCMRLDFFFFFLYKTSQGGEWGESCGKAVRSSS